MIEEFNKGIYDIIIASDEKSEAFGDEPAAENGDAKKAKEEPKKKKKGDKSKDAESQPNKKRKTQKQDQEYGVSRGKSPHLLANNAFIR